MKHGSSQTGKLPVLRKRLSCLQGDKTTTAFAEELGLSRQTVGFYLNGDRIPDALTLKEIAQVCGVSTDWLLGISDTRSSDESIKSIVEKSGLSEASANALVSANKLASVDHTNDDLIKFRELYNIPDFVDADSLFTTCLSIPDFVNTIITALVANDTLLAQISTAFNLWFSSFPEVQFDEIAVDNSAAFLSNNRIAIDRSDFIKLCTYEIANTVADALSRHYGENQVDKSI